MNLQPGQVFADKYRIVRLIGQGGMGTVFEGENVRIHRKVAIKTLHASVAEKRDVVTRFEREAQAAGRIGSSHIVEVLDLGDLPDGSRFMVMEFLEGSTLEQRIRSRGRLAPAEAVPIVVQMLDGLAAAHHAGIIHRDLKPANVFLLASKGGQADFVKILDFGVSKFNVLATDEMSMTRTGSVVGTPFYMSPEQAKGSKGLDGRSDLYAAGVILYECITGQVPFHAETFNELIFKIVLESPPPAESFVPDLDPTFAAIIRKAMSRDVGDRFQSAEDFKHSLNDWASRNAHGLLPGPGGTTAVLPPGANRPFPMHAAMGSQPAISVPEASPPGGYPGGAASPPGGYAAPVPVAPGGPRVFGGYEDPIVVPKRSSGALVGGIAFIAVVGLGAGGFAAYRWSEARAAAAEVAGDLSEAESSTEESADDDEAEDDEAEDDDTEDDDTEDDDTEDDEAEDDETADVAEDGEADAEASADASSATVASGLASNPSGPSGAPQAPPSTFGAPVGKTAPPPTTSPPGGKLPNEPGGPSAPASDPKGSGTPGGESAPPKVPPRTVSGEL